MSALIKVRRAWGPEAEGEVLVMHEGFSPRYDLNRINGLITRIGHSAEGHSVKNRILVIPTAKGGVAGGWAFFDLRHKGIGPLGLVFGCLNPVMVQGAVLANIPITEGWDQNMLETLKNGDKIRIEPKRKLITII